MPKAERIGVSLAIAGVVLALQGCWEDDQDRLTLLGAGACRVADGSGGHPKNITGVSLKACRALCFVGDLSCVAVEYNGNNEACEIHSKPVTKFERVEGVQCYVIK